MALLIKDPNKRWSSLPIDYRFDSTITAVQKSRWSEAVAIWEDGTPFRFRHDSGATATDFIELVQNPVATAGRSSSIGRAGGRQTIELGSNIAVDTIVHEIGHAIGLKHEHQRTDRNAFVNVFTGNIDTTRYGNQSGNFSMVNANDFIQVTPYDFLSIMHYGTRNWALAGTNTLEVIEGYGYSNQSGQIVVGRLPFMSYWDLCAARVAAGQEKPAEIWFSPVISAIFG